MFFEVKKRELAGRIGKLYTRHGVVETPIILPVVDSARQVPSLDVISNIGFRGIITNAYLFYKRNRGLAKSIHSELGWHNTIMTDSGGYQILLYGDIGVDNKTIVEYEKAIGSDLAVILDIPTGSTMSREEAERAVFETYRRGLESLPLIQDSDQLWVYPVQGAPFKDLLLRSARLASRLPYHVYAVGSPTVMLEKYKYAELVELVAIVRAHIPPDRPLHVFGVGHPMIIPFLVAVGADMFDSSSYILYARDGRYLSEEGTKNIRELEYFPCACPVCSKYTPQDLIEMQRPEREKLLAIHNLYVLHKEVKVVKQAIRENRLWELLEWRASAHPSLKEAFLALIKLRALLEKFASKANPSGKAILLISGFSRFNPRVTLNVGEASNMLAKRVENKVVILVPAYKKPYTTQKEYKTLSEAYKASTSVEILFIHPLLGIIPPELTSTYPFYQHECRISRRTLGVKLVRDHIRALASSKPSKIVLVTGAWLSNRVADKLLKGLKDTRVEITTCKLSEALSLIPPQSS